MNILAVDVGNTRVAIGACVNGKVVAVERLEAADIRSDLLAAADRLKQRLRPQPAPRVVIASVNPLLAEQVLAAVRQAGDWPILFVGQDIELPMEMDVDSPETVGVDRVLIAAAAYEAVGGPVVVAVLGTALTINAVSADGRFLGGVICPGLAIGARALHEATAALPQVAPTRPASPFGRNTPEAIQAGLFYQAGGAIREVVERMATELGQWPHLVLTGGDAELVAPAYEFVDSVVPDLCLRGINLAYRKHVEAHAQR